MSGLRVLMIISSFYPKIGGAERQALLLARTLPEFGVRATVLTRRYPGMPDRQIMQGVEIFRVGIYRRDKVGSLVSALAWLQFCIKHHKSFDIFHAHQPFASAFVAGTMARLTGKPAVAKIPGSGSASVLRWRGLLLGKVIDAFVVTNRDSEIILAERFPQSKICLIPNGIDFYEEDVAGNCGPRSGNTVLSVGRLDPGKGIDLLLKSWPRVLSAIPEARLIVVGSGSKMPDYKAIVQQWGLECSVQFVGEIDPLQIRTWYYKAVCFVQPSLSEGVSNSLLEAIMARLPVVASRIPGNTDVIVDEGMGLLYDPLDLDGLARAIILTLHDPGSAHERADRAYQYVRENFNMKRIAGQYAALYRQLVEVRTA